MAILVEDTEALLSTCTGNIPLILSSPHGGYSGILGIDGKRQSFTAATPGCGFNNKTDTQTKELTQRVVETMASQGIVPYAVISDIVRADLDLNRTRAENVYKSEVSNTARVRALQLYDAYYDRLWQHIEMIKGVFDPENINKVLLLDIHGAEFAKGDLDLTTTSPKGLSSSQINIVYPNESHSITLWDALSKEGFEFRNIAGQSHEKRPSCNLIEAFGIHNDNGINAVQIEFNRPLRNRGEYQKTADRFAKALIAFAHATYSTASQDLEEWAALFLSVS